jgi:hypothetical protein
MLLSDSDDNSYLQAYADSPSTYNTYYTQKPLDFTPLLVSSVS